MVGVGALAASLLVGGAANAATVQDDTPTLGGVVVEGPGANTVQFPDGTYVKYPEGSLPRFEDGYGNVNGAPRRDHNRRS